VTSAPKAIAAVVRGLHHVAIAVESIERARGTWEKALGLSALPLESVPDQKVNVLVLFAGRERIELVEPAAPDSPITKFLRKRGSGLHHLAWAVDDLESAIARLEASGVELIDASPREGAHGTRVAFVHPRSTGGVLMELVEEPNR